MIFLFKQKKAYELRMSDWSSDVCSSDLNTVFGPFHVAGAPELPMGSRISHDGKGESCLFAGRVLDLDGRPIAGAVLDVWSDNADGFYDVQQPALPPDWNNRGRFTTDRKSTRLNSRH